MPQGLPCRITLSIMAFLGLMCGFLQRGNLSVAIVYMVKAERYSTGAYVSDCAAENYSIPFENFSINGITPHRGEGEFDWHEEVQGWLLAAFFWGFLPLQIVGGRLAEYYGGKHVFGTGMLVSTIFTLLSPAAARIHYSALFFCRFMVGLGQGVGLPSIHCLIGKWIPPHERSRITTCCYTGQLSGMVFGLPIAGFLCNTDFEDGWPLVFYVYGLLTLFWYLGWLFFVYNSPEEHTHISLEEKRYIRSHLHSSRKGQKMPWKAALKSKALWAITTAHVGQNWGYFMLLTQLPTYMRNILGFDIESNGLLSCLPYLMYWICGDIFSVTADTLIRKYKFRVGTVRKIFNSIGLLGPALCLLTITFLECHIHFIVMCLIVSGALNGGILVGFIVNHIDIANNFAGTLMGVTSSLATIPGIVSPITVGMLTKGNQTRQRWYIIFYITSTIYTVAAIVYIIFASGENESWNDITVSEEGEQDSISEDEEKTENEKNGEI